MNVVRAQVPSRAIARVSGIEIVAKGALVESPCAVFGDNGGPIVDAAPARN